VINAGLRLDVFDNDDFVFSDPSNPPWDRTNHTLFMDQLVKKEADVIVSPRLGMAFPVTERTVFHLQYGKFVQAPAFGNIYAGSTWYDAIFTGGTSFQNPFGIGLEPEQTTQYEIGFNQQFADTAAFDVTLFYKNISGQLQSQKVTTDPTSQAIAYNVLVNGDFATTSGIEVALNLRRTNRIAGQLNYTFSRSLGTGSVPNTAIAGVELGSVPTLIAPLDFNRRIAARSISIIVSARVTAARFGRTGEFAVYLQQRHPMTLAFGEFGQQDASFAGEITDPRSRRPLENVNASLTPWNSN
jgi:outer membrane receptor protein involved in Fe transport